MTKNSHGLWVSDTVVRPGDRIPAGGGDYIINISNTSARFKFLTPGSVDYRYLSTDQLKPRRIARWTDSHFTILRSSSLGGGDNHWVGGPSLPRDDIPDYGYIYFRCQIPNRFRIMSSNRLPTLDIKGLDYAGDPNDINTNNNAGPHRDPRPVYDLGTGSIIDTLTNPRSVRLTFQNTFVLEYAHWVNSPHNPRILADHAGYFVTGSIFDVMWDGSGVPHISA